MATSEEHYRQLLAKHYSWMFGSFEDKVREQKAVIAGALQAADAIPGGLAVDLGSGPGFQAIALAQLGFSPVIAIDTSVELLDELQSRAAALPILTKNGDVLCLSEFAGAGSAGIVVCMGDTLTHLESKFAVSGLFQSVYRSLAPGRLFVITHRDLTLELFGTDRFIPVKSDENTVMTCFLEYESPEYVVVYDLIQTCEGSDWKLNKSCYRKLRLSVEWVIAELVAAGFEIKSKGAAGRLVQVTAKKP